MAIILGIDPGSRITGFGLVETKGDKIHYVQSGAIKVKGDFIGRLETIFREVGEIVTIYRPDVVSIEKIFVHHNPDTAIKLGQARGAAICAVVAHSLPVSEYTPAEVKKSVVGNGRASKDQVQYMVQTLLRLPGLPQEDAADALAAALCYINHHSGFARIEEATSQRRGRLR